MRHGESLANLAGVHSGPEEALTPRGLAEGRALGKCLREVPFDVAFVSPLLRTRATADLILVFHPAVPVVLDARLRERDNGTFVGTAHGSRRTAAQSAGVAPRDFRPVGGESTNDMEQRVRAFVRDLTYTYRPRCSLIVSHLGPISAVVRELSLSAGFQNDRVRNGSISVLDMDCDPVVRLLDDTRHLDQVDGS